MKLKWLDRQVDPYGTIPMDVRRMKALLYFNELFKELPPGDIVECGVGLGRTLLILGFLADAEKRSVWGFDSFQGFPEPSVEDTSPRNPKKGEWNVIRPSDITAIFRVAGLRQPPTLIPGFFEHTIHTYTGRIALLHIDVDLYQSYVDCLTLVSSVVPGGIVCFDEYGSTEFPGATQAVDEFLAGTSYHLQKHEPTGKYYFRT